MSNAHIHEWEVVTGTELGDVLARCRCGAERLMTGTVVRMRRPGAETWETPYSWNRAFYGRREEEPSG